MPFKIGPLPASPPSQLCGTPCISLKALSASKQPTCSICLQCLANPYSFFKNMTEALGPPKRISGLDLHQSPGDALFWLQCLDISFSPLDIHRAHVAFIFSELSQVPGICNPDWNPISGRAVFSYLVWIVVCYVPLYKDPFFFKLCSLSRQWW